MEGARFHIARENLCADTDLEKAIHVYREKADEDRLTSIVTMASIAPKISSKSESPFPRSMAEEEPLRHVSSVLNARPLYDAAMLSHLWTCSSCPRDKQVLYWLYALTHSVVCSKACLDLGEWPNISSSLKHCSARGR